MTFEKNDTLFARPWAIVPTTIGDPGMMAWSSVEMRGWVIVFFNDGICKERFTRPIGLFDILNEETKSNKAISATARRRNFIEKK